MKKLLFIAIAALFAIHSNAQWVQTLGLSGENIKHNCMAAINTYIFAGTNSNGVYVSNNYGLSWTQVNSGLTNTNIYSLASNGTKIYAGTTSGGAFVSSDYGVTWTSVNTGLPAKNITAFTFSGTNIFAGTQGSGVYLSTDNGLSWSPANSGIPTNTMGDINITALAVNSTYIFAATADTGVYYSTNNGTSWTRANHSSMSNTRAFAFYNGKTFAGHAGAGVFMSADNGSSWSLVNTGLSHHNVQSLVLASSGRIFAGTLGGSVFLTVNDGSSWMPVATGLEYGNVQVLTVCGSYLFAGVTTGVYKRMLNEMTEVKEMMLNEDIRIYPNPATDHITIDMAGITEQNCTVSVSDMQGKAIMSATINPGASHELDLSALSEGVYFISLQNDKKVYRAKILISR